MNGTLFFPQCSRNLPQSAPAYQFSKHAEIECAHVIMVSLFATHVQTLHVALILPMVRSKELPSSQSGLQDLLQVTKAPLENGILRYDICLLRSVTFVTERRPA